MPPPVLDQSGTSTSSGGTTTTINVTAAANRIIMVFTTIGASAAGATPSLSIAGAGLTWTSASVVSAQNAGGVFFTVQCWWAYTSGALSAQTVTITSSVTIDDAASVYGTWSGAVSAAPLDPGVNAKFAISSSGQPLQGNITTTLANDVSVYCAGTNGTPAPSGQTAGSVSVGSIDNGGGARYSHCYVFQLSFSALQTNTAMGFNLNSIMSGLIAVTLTADTVAAQMTQARAVIMA